MSFLSSLRSVVSNIANPVRGLAAATTGGLSLAAPPAVQTRIGLGIATFAAGAGAGLLGAPRPPTSAEAYRMSGGGAPQAPRRRSPSSYAQMRGAQRMRRRSSGYMVSPPAAGMPPSSTGFFYRRV